VESVNGPAKSRIKIHLWMTGGGELKAMHVRDCPCEVTEYAGRPGWKKIFDKAHADNRGQKVGVFLCGNPMIGTQLKENCILHTNLDEGTEFNYFEENF